MKINKVYVGDNMEVLKTFPDNSVDSVVTDPPYGISFMGKKWDYDVPSVETWKEVFRVLKPGGHMLVACGTRTQHRMAVNIEDAGFEIRDIVAWVYGSGFPKSHDISKAIDKMMGAEREVVGSYRGAVQNNDSVGGGFNASKGADEHGRTTVNITVPATDQAKQWQGWGTALKPSMELWTLARKPLDGTVAQNVLKHGVGGINIDGCRVGDEIIGGGTMPDLRDVGKKSKEAIGIDKLSFGQVKNAKRKEYKTHQGRFPANVIHDGSDEVVSLFPETQSGLMTPNHTRTTDGSPNGIYGKFDVNHPLSETYGDSGSAARFFYVAKASQEERNFGLYDFEEVELRGGGGRAKQGYDLENEEEKRLHLVSGKFGAVKAKKKNIHPTVKPIDLMRYLVRLVTPPNGICLDPYLGSGTTAIACEMEKFRWIGIELMPEYAEIAKARISAVKDFEATLDTKTIIKESIKEDKEKELGIMNIFDFMEVEE